MENKKKLYRSKKDKMLAGVCGGIAEYFEIDSTIARLVFVLLLFMCGGGLLAYIICAIVIPQKPDEEKAEKVEYKVEDAPEKSDSK